VPLDPQAGWLPDLDRVPWDRLAILWLNTPDNPTGAVAPLDFLEEAAARCRRAGALLASDEAYSELWFAGDPPPSALQVSDRTGVVAFHTLSKRSSVPGWRSGFAAGDAELLGAYARHRAHLGTTPPAAIQRASVVAWGDEEHVAVARERYGRKRAVVLPALQAAGLQDAGGPGTFFLWLRVPGGDDVACAERWLERGISLMPGSLLGAGGEGHVRVALVPPLEACERAAAILAG
jgi:acetylornithine aminotransferase